MSRWLLSIAAVLALGMFAWGAPPDAEQTWTVDTVLQRIAPLTHDASNRWPMITWEPFLLATNDTSFQKGIPLPLTVYRELLRRGLTQAIRMNTNYLAIGKALQEAGSPVIMMEGNGGDGPFARGDDFQHHLPPDYKIPEGERHYPCAMIRTGWEREAARVRDTMTAFKQAGVTVNAVWLDWEVEPLWWSTERWRQARACSRCRETFPSGTLWNFLVYMNCIRPYRQQLFSDYLAAPILDVFPQCSVSNWDSLFSTRKCPAYNWYGDIVPPMDIGRFTASMPAVYASNASFTDYWYGRLGAPFRHLRSLRCIGEPEAVTDRVYTHVMLGSFSANAGNAMRMAPAKKCIPWVSGFVIDNVRKDTPVLSRDRYREILRHVWLRGADAMQVFNPLNDAHPQYRLLEVEDACAIYDEMLAYRRFLDDGEVVNLRCPSFQDTGAIWSGLRLGNEAVVRAFTQGDREVRFAIRPWADAARVEIVAPPRGVTYLLRRDGDRVRAD